MNTRKPTQSTTRLRSNMLRFNLLERVIVEKPYEKTSFGWSIYTNQHLVRRRLFAQSINRWVEGTRGPRRSLYRHIIRGGFFEGVLTPEGQRRFRRGRSLASEHVELRIFKDHAEASHTSERISTMHVGGGLDGLLHGLNRFVAKKGFEFTLADVPPYTVSNVPVVPRALLLMRPNLNGSMYDDMSRPKNQLGFVWGPEKSRSNGFKQGQAYCEKQIRDVLVSGGELDSSITMEEQIAARGFVPVWRPSANRHDAPCYAYKPDSRDAGILVPLVMIEDLDAIEDEGQFMPHTVIFAFERTALIAEGRIIPVQTESNGTMYYTQRALNECLERGGILRLNEGGRVIHATADAAWKYFGDGAILLDRRSWGANDILQEYLRGKALSSSDRRSFPLLACAIDVMNTLPRDTDRHFEAARIAAEHGASEHVLVALLLGRELSSRLTLASASGRVNDVRIHDHLFEVYRSYGISGSEWGRRMSSVVEIVERVGEIGHFDVGYFEIDSAHAIQAALQLFLNTLHPRLPDIEARDVHLAYFANVLGKLKFMKSGELSESEIRNLRLVIAPLAERDGFREIAEQMRNEMFRISNEGEYQRMRSEIERSNGMSYAEMQRHIQDTAAYIQKALNAVGISEERYEIAQRVKLPYSAWEKMKGRKVDNPALVWDELGLKIVTKDDGLARRVSYILEQILPPLDDPSFVDKQALVPFLRGIKKPFRQDHLLKSKKGGWSGITLLRQTRQGLPLEVQVTSVFREINNTFSRAAHWKYKVRKEVEAFYGVEIDRKVDIDIDDDRDLSVILYGEFNGSMTETVEAGLKYAVVDDDMTAADLCGLLGKDSDNEIVYANYWDVVKAARPRVDQFTPLSFMPQTGSAHPSALILPSALIAISMR